MRAVSHRTETALTVVPLPAMGAEDVLVGDDETVYTGTEDGALWAVSPDGDQIRRVGTVPGRPLGLEWLPDGRLLVCDARAGLLAVEADTGATEVLVASVAGLPMRFCNNAAVAEDGTIYFSDSSTEHPIERWKHEMVEDTGTGRLLRRDPDGTVTVLLTGLRFANGVALAADESFVCVAETVARTVQRLWLTGPRAGAAERLAEDLPGYPDNLCRGSDGLIWVTIASPRDPVLEQLLRAPLLVRKLAARLPEALQPKPQRTVRVVALDAEGSRVHDCSLPAEGFHMATGVREDRGRVWVGSLHEPAIAWFRL